MARWRKNIRQSHNNKSRCHQKFIGNRVENRAEFRLLIKTPCDKTVNAVGRARHEKNQQSPTAMTVEKRYGEGGNQCHPQKSEQIRNGKNV